MFKTLRNALAIPDLRKKIFYTILIVIIFRIGAAIPVPFLDPEALRQWAGGVSDSSLFGVLDVLSGGSLKDATIFALGIMPYINSSIIMNLLTIAIPPLERMAKEGEEGRKKIASITRYVTVFFGLFLGTIYFLNIRTALIYTKGFSFFFAAAVIVLSFTAGTALVMWLGEQINDKGIGNGISIILFAGIVSRAPQILTAAAAYIEMGLKDPTQRSFLFIVPLLFVIFILVIGFVVLMHYAERRVPVQYAKRVVGRKMYGGQNTHIPIKVNMSGVMPIIFASSIVNFPVMIREFMSNKESIIYRILGVMDMNGVLYPVLYFLLIIAFSYFYVMIQYNPIEIANNLRKNNGTVPGLRPGKPTSDFIKKIVYKITIVGALFLGVIATLPIIIGSIFEIRYIAVGGTSILIVVGVVLETMRAVESQMMMRHYKGFLE